MGRLQSANDQREIALIARSLVGRSTLAWVRLDHDAVSREHAIIVWDQGNWCVRDLDSRNGTTVNAQRCPHGYHILAKGDELAFGDVAETWRLVDNAIPPPAARSDDGVVRVGGHGLLLLPDDRSPAMSIDWDGQMWRVDDGSCGRRVHSGDSVDVGDQRFELILPCATGVTTRESSASRAIADVTAVFEFDRSEEFVRLTLRQGIEAFAVVERAFNYTLLLMARIRAHDRDRGLSDAEAGWIMPQELAKQLRSSLQKINLDVFRARRLLSESGIRDGAGIVERRQRHHQLRFGIRDIVLAPL